MERNLQIALRKAVDDVARAADALRQPEGLSFIEKAAHLIVNCYRRKNKILIAGNGGSLCDAMHFAEELTGQFRHQRPALAAIALNDPGLPERFVPRFGLQIRSHDDAGSGSASVC